MNKDISYAKRSSEELYKSQDNMLKSNYPSKFMCL